MELIERYVSAVGRRLPHDRRAEIQAELRSTLHDATERPDGAVASDEEVVALLRQLGHPDAVAAAYFPAGQSLIGPELYPTFLRIMRLVLPLVAVVIAGIHIAGFVADGPAFVRVGSMLAGYLGALIHSLGFAVGVVFAIFVVLQRMGVSPPFATGDWDPRDLPHVGDEDLASRTEALAGIVAPVIILNVVSALTYSLDGSRAPTWLLAVGRALTQNLSSVVAASCLSILLNAVLLIQGYWRWSTRIATAAADLFGVYVFYRVAVDLAAALPSIVAGGLPEPLVRWLITSLYVSVGVAAVIVVVDNGRSLLRAFVRPRQVPLEAAPPAPQ